MPPHTVSENGANIELKDTNSLVFYAFINPYYEAPAVPQPTLVNTISLTDGDWFPSLNYQHQATDTTNTYYEYKISGDPTNTAYFIAYNWTTRKWLDTNPTTSHNTFGTSATDTGASGATSRETAENPAIVYVMGEASNTLMASFNNPYYEAPSVPDIQPIVNTGGSWNGVHSWASPTSETINGSVEYHYKLSFDTNSRIAYRTIDKTWYDADTSSQPTALSSDAFSTQSLALVNPQYVWIGDTSATNTTFYISFNTPHYEA